MDDVINDLQERYKNRMDSKIVKKEITESLNPYFVNFEELEKNYNSSSLLSVYEFIMKYSEDELFAKGLNDVLSHYRNALKANKDSTSYILFAKADDFVDSENKMWNIRNNKPKLDKELYDSVMECFRYTGSSLEISVKSIISELYALHLIINNQKFNYQNICGDNFGHNINLLLEAGYFESILKVKPHNIKLSDWRNISMHHSYSVEKDMVVLSFGKFIKDIIKINYDEFMNYIYQIMRSSNILNIARCIFLYDNMSTIGKHDTKRQLNNKFRDDMLFNQIKISLSSDGFKLKDIFRDESGLKVELQDLQSDTYDSNYINQREWFIAHVFGSRANGLSAERIDVKYYSYEGIVVDVFWISLSLKNNYNMYNIKI